MTTIKTPFCIIHHNVSEVADADEDNASEVADNDVGFLLMNKPKSSKKKRKSSADTNYDSETPLKIRKLKDRRASSKK